ncbi:MAG: LamG domain-containing protein [Polyangiaceae bacterium]
MHRLRDKKRSGAWLSVVGLALVCGAAVGCGGADDKFSAQSDDENTESLTNAVIGTPTGTTTISSSGVVTTEATSGKAGSGAGGSAGSGGGPVSSAGAPSAGGSTSGSAGASTGPAAGAGGIIGQAGSTDPADGSGFGQWSFDDCSPTSHFMADSSGNNANAQQALKASCVAGISGQGVQFRSAKDVVQVPDEPQFTVDKHVGVAAWVKPNTVSGDQPIVIKRLNNKTAFSLGIHNGSIQMSVVLANGKTIISSAPIKAKTWTHVAGMFDGTFVFLFINGQQFGQVFGAGSVRDVFAPIRIGATTQTQYFDGVIDEVFLSTQTISADTLTALSCIAHPSTLSVTPAKGGPVPFDTSVHYSVSVTDNDIGACGGKQYQAFFENSELGIAASFNPDFLTATPGQKLTFGADVTGSDSADPGVHSVPFVVDSFSNSKFGFEQLNGALSFELTPPTGCFVTTRRELIVTGTSVVDDPVRTAGTFDPGFGGGVGGAGGATGGGGDAGALGEAGAIAIGGRFGTGGAAGVPVKPNAVPAAAPQTAGVWSFGYLMRQMAPTAAQAPALTLALLKHWLTDQKINGFTVAARPAMQQQLLDIWPKTATGELDLDQSPLTLQAIVNRIDTRNLAESSAGEGRFVFGVNGNFNFQQFAVIVEYNLPAKTQQDVTDWANRWHALASHPFPSEEYNAALEAVTRRFTDRNASPASINGSALSELRTNEIALSFQWELRSFALGQSGMFDEIPVAETPDLNFNGSSTFADFVNQNAAAIIAEVPGANAHTVPLTFENQAFQAGSVFNNQTLWNAAGITDPDARFHASSNTCNGCHSPETGTFNFLMVTPRFPGTEAQLSPFLTGTVVNDQFSGQTRIINDLSRRKADLTALVCTATTTK